MRPPLRNALLIGAGIALVESVWIVFLRDLPLGARYRMSLYFALWFCVVASLNIILRDRVGLRFGLQWLAVVLSVPAGLATGFLAQSLYGALPQQVALPVNVDLALSLDASNSVGSASSGGNPMNEAKGFAHRIVSQLASSERVALVSFNDQARVVHPLSPLWPESTRAAAHAAIDALAGGGGTDLDAGLQAALDVLQANQQPLRRQAVILASDGGGEVHSSTVRRAIRLGIPIHTLGLGERPDASLLRSISTAAAGRYFSADESSQLVRLYSHLESKELDMNNTPDRQSARHWVPSSGWIPFRLLAWAMAGLGLGLTQLLPRHPLPLRRVLACAALGAAAGLLFDPFADWVQAVGDAGCRVVALTLLAVAVFRGLGSQPTVSARTTVPAALALSASRRSALESETPRGGVMENDASIFFSGVHSRDGAYFRPPLQVPGSPESDRFAAQRRSSRGVARGIDPTDLSQAGWGIVYSSQCSDSIKEALSVLIAHRRSQANAGGELFRELVYQPGESRTDFLARHGASPGQAQPQSLPYYLLFIGDPDEVPFDFQFQVGGQRAVGRLSFQTADEYALYAENLVENERSASPRRDRVTLFGVRNADDHPTELCEKYLIEPLESGLRRGRFGWDVYRAQPRETSKAGLAHFLGGDKTPSLMFCAGHGVCFDPGESRQEGCQGSLVCSDWPGPMVWKQRMREDFYFAAADLDPAADLTGSALFLFACFTAGTPAKDSFGPRGGRTVLAPKPFVAQLPQRLLGRSRGALAVIGHVDQAFWHSFMWEHAGAQIGTIQSVLEGVMEGLPIGFAMDPLAQRQQDLAAELCRLRLEMDEAGQDPQALLKTYLWTAYHDARSYLLFGDPAARIPTSSGP